jgi:cytochrome c oxidase subunit 2
MIVFAVKYNRKRHPNPKQIKDNMVLEVTWIVVPLILVLFMFYYGYKAFLPQRNIPENAMPVKVISKMWDWTFDYGANKFSKDTLVVPVHTPIRLDMISLDVNHSFYVPAFRVKEDVVPGITTQMWFIAERKGIYEILCAEYCGLRHSYMIGWVKVVDSLTYENWLAAVEAIDPDAEHRGYTLLKQNACIGCHSLDGAKLVGPSFKDLYGQQNTVITSGKERVVIVDSAYLADAIFDPDKDIVKGYSKGLMKSYRSLLKDEDVVEIIDFLKTGDKR